MTLNGRYKIEDGQEFAVDMFRREDAEGISHLFRAVYGEGYPVKLVYNPTGLIEAFDKRENMPAVARTGKGDIVGYCALYRSAPNAELYELGQALVLPSYRSTGIISKLCLFLYETAAKQRMDAVFGEAVCNHVYTQKTAAGLLGDDSETAIEIDLMPEEAYVAEKSSSGRVAAMLMFGIFSHNPQTIYIPKAYKDPLDYILSAKNIRLADKHTFRESSGDAPANVKTVFRTQFFDFANVARITFSEAGGDFETIFEKIEEDMPHHCIVVIQVWLKLATPWIGSIVDTLRGKGFFLGGVLPRWFGDDGLLMQKVIGSPNWEGIELHSVRANNILKLIKADWVAVGLG
jgi:N-acetylglutamate synthase-like GNAT family acetyltransferase